MGRRELIWDNRAPGPMLLDLLFENIAHNFGALRQKTSMFTAQINAFHGPAAYLRAAQQSNQLLLRKTPASHLGYGHNTILTGPVSFQTLKFFSCNLFSIKRYSG